MPTTVSVPAQFEPVFRKAEESVARFFGQQRQEPTRGTIDIFGERYILVRAASMSVDFFETVAALYAKEGPSEANNIARQLLYDVAHAIGRQDARNFSKKMELRDPIEKLSAGPVHFAYAGWAFVEILPESSPSPDDDYCLIYDHPYSFESAAWHAAGKGSDFPVCIMNAGYSSGWCEESFGLELVATEITCQAKGDPACRFVMAPPSRIEGRIAAYLKKEPGLAERISKYQVPGFFKRKEIEAALRESEERFRALFDKASDGLVVADTETKRFLMGNEALATMLGYSHEEVRRLGVGDIHPPEALPSVLAAFEKQASGEIELAPALPVLRKDGSVFLADVRASVITIGARTYLLGVFRDITERKLAEERIRKMTARLEQRVHERTAQIESVNRELESFAYVVSHDLKAPLRAISSLSTWLAADYADKLDEQGRESLRLLVQRAKRMDGLITAILEYSRVGRAGEDLRLVDVDALVREVVELLEVPEQVAVTVETRLPTLLCGRTSIYQVFQNLIGNAVQHLNRPKGRIRVGCLDEGPTFYVADDGPGIEARYFDKIFEMFQTLEPKEDAKSTGVGLTIVKKIVEL
jgi:PAS domain S-box-containing protein